MPFLNRPTGYIGSALSTQATKRGAEIALSCGAQRLSWALLQQRVMALAQNLHSRHGTQQAIGLDMIDPLLLVQAFMAVARAGHRALVFDPQWTPDQRQRIVQQLNMTALLQDTDVDGLNGSHEASYPPEHLPAHLPEPEADWPFYVGFTSGSTGLPKGYRRNHDSWLASFAISDQLFDLGPDDRVMAPGSLATSLHLYGVIHALQRSIPVTLVSKFRPRTVWQTLLTGKVTALYGTPTQVQLLLQMATHERQAPNTSLRHLIISGAKWPDDTRAAIHRFFPQAQLTEFYGTSEMSFVALHNDTRRAPSGSVGKPVPGVDVCIGHTPDNPVPTGQRARIWVRSALLFDGYECGGGDEIARHGEWLTVGDHGYLDAAGNLFLVGREKRMLVSSGQNLYPEELESWLTQHPQIQQAAVLGLPDALRGQRIVGVLHGDANALTPDALKRYSAQRLPIAQVPRDWFWLDHWPLTPSGKTDFMAIQTWLVETMAHKETR